MRDKTTSFLRQKYVTSFAAKECFGGRLDQHNFGRNMNTLFHHKDHNVLGILLVEVITVEELVSHTPQKAVCIWSRGQTRQRFLAHVVVWRWQDQPWVRPRRLPEKFHAVDFHKAYTKEGHKFLFVFISFKTSMTRTLFSERGSKDFHVKKRWVFLFNLCGKRRHIPQIPNREPILWTKLNSPTVLCSHRHGANFRQTEHLIDNSISLGPTHTVQGNLVVCLLLILGLNVLRVDTSFHRASVRDV